MRFFGKTSAFVVSLIVTLGAVAANAQMRRTPDEVRRADLAGVAHVERKVMARMRDGVRLATDVYRPKDHLDGPLPVIFWRTPYNFNTLSGGRLMFALESVRRGYAFVIQNERGKFFSEGDWEILGRPPTDGYDALTWIAAQPWSNGKVGTIGCSSSAEWQLGLAAMDHPAHAAMIPMGAGAGIGRMGPHYEQGNFYRGGAIQLLMPAWLYGNQNTQRPTLPRDLSDADRVRLSRYYDLAADTPEVDWKEAFKHLPLSELISHIDGPKGVYADMITRGPDDPAWYEGGLYHDNESFGVPALWMDSWYDISVSPNLALYNHARAHGADPTVRDHQYLVIAPTGHCRFYTLETPMIVGERNMGDVSFGFLELVYDWFDAWLKGERNDFARKHRKVQYFAMGVNEWRSASQWPPKGVSALTLYLESEEGANSLFGDGRLTPTMPDDEDGADRFPYDPMNPVPTVGGGLCCMAGAAEAGAFDQRSVEAREDVLVYTSESLSETLEVTGPIEATLYASSDARDTDFTVKLVDVAPDGRAFNLADTILRARYRDGFHQEVFMQPGEVYRVQLPPMATSNVFGKGHCIRVEISSSNSPRYDRNLNTGGRNAFESEGVLAHNVVHHSRSYPSHIVLSVIE